ncbi:hypothetical protein [Hymenobacter coccineus]|nr:hypothetical protein [Hymenobacter coccineus]
MTVIGASVPAEPPKLTVRKAVISCEYSLERGTTLPSRAVL